MTKLVRLASDLHLEGFQGAPMEQIVENFLPRDDRDKESVLVLAGDISSRPQQLFEFLFSVELRFEKVLYVMGNHETYRHDYQEWCESVARQFERDLVNTVYALHTPKVLVHGGHRFILAPLWGDGGVTAHDQLLVQDALNDFFLIGFEGRQFRVTDMIELHRQHRSFIYDELQKPHDGKTLVVSHHLPSRRLVSQRFWPKDGSDGINGGFVGDCIHMMLSDYAPNFWFHGHTHDTIHQTIGKTIIHANPRGYRGEWSTKFNQYSNLFIQIED